MGFPRSTVRHKFTALVGLSLLAVLMIGGVYIFSQQATTRAFEKRAGIVATRGALSAIDLRIADLGAASQRFLLDQSSVTAATLPEAAEHLKTAIDSLKSVNAGALSDAEIARLSSAQSVYAAAVSESVEAQRKLGFIDQSTVELAASGGVTEPDGLNAKLSNAAAGISKRLGEEIEFDESAILFRMAAVLAAIAEKEAKLIAYGTPEYLTMLQGHVTELTALVAADETDDAFAEEVSPQVAGYSEILKDWSAAQAARRDAILRLDTAMADLKTAAETAHHSVGKALSSAAAAFSRSTQIANWTVLATVVLALTALSSFGFVFGRFLLRGLRDLAGRMAALAKGDTDFRIDGDQRSDELGRMWRAVRVFRENAIERAELMTASEREQEERAQRQAAIDRLIADFQSGVRGLLEDVAGNAGKMQETAEKLSTVATQTSSQAADAGSASETALQNVEAVASAAEELSSSVSEISRQVQQTSETVSKAVTAAQTSDQKITGLAETAERIGNVVELIRDIAEQTNLLALNATIEAARAGEAGRGFAVVASEVKELATQTGKATEEISTQIGAIQGATEETVAAIRAIAETMGDVSAATTAISEAVGEQANATGEIARNVENAAAGASDVSRNVGGVAEAAGDTQRSADQVLTASDSVSTKTRDLHAMVDDFLRRVAAA